MSAPKSHAPGRGSQTGRLAHRLIIKAGRIGPILLLVLGCPINVPRPETGEQLGAQRAAGAKAISTFSFASLAATGTIDENAKTIAVSVPAGTNVTALASAGGAARWASGKRADPADAGPLVKALVEAQDTVYAMALHDSHMKGIARGQGAGTREHGFGSLHIRRFYGVDLVNDTDDGIERWLDGVAPVDRRVAVEYLLQHLGVRYEPFVPCN
jgi:hypothetical protein